MMTAEKVIQEIIHLPREEQSRVLEFAFELARKRQLSGKELSALAQRMVDSKDPAEVERLKAEMTRGFYGD
jgi:isocitrate/isopropylmalate dehydrogenase